MLGLGLGSGAWAAEPDAQAGQALLEKHCFGCHGTEVYTREDRRVQNMSQLSNQVQRCDQMLGLKLFETDLENITAYLNEAYYKF
jgi:mono/diheme cytochrome c family protein